MGRHFLRIAMYAMVLSCCFVTYSCDGGQTKQAKDNEEEINRLKRQVSDLQDEVYNLQNNSRSTTRYYDYENQKSDQELQILPFDQQIQALCDEMRKIEEEREREAMKKEQEERMKIYEWRNSSEQEHYLKVGDSYYDGLGQKVKVE